jgi:hypothetical protein
MRAIVDLLYLKVVEVGIIKNQYPHCQITLRSGAKDHIQQYQLVLPDEDENDDSYYNFLLDNLIAMCSRKFHARLARDKDFRSRIRARADSNLDKMKAATDRRVESRQWVTRMTL